MRYIILGIIVATSLAGCSWRRGSASPTPGGQQVLPVENEQDKRLPVPGNVVDGIAATVNGRVVTRSEVQTAVATRRFLITQQEKNPAVARQKLEEAEREGLRDLIDRELILAEFEKQGGNVRPEIVEAEVERIIRQQFDGDRDAFLEELRRSGVTLRKFKDLRSKMLVVQFMQSSVVGTKAPPTPAQVRDFYKGNVADYREEGEIRLRTITIPKGNPGDLGPPAETLITQRRRLAADIRKRLEGGSDFAAMAKHYSQDSAAPRGGDRGLIGRDTLRRDLSDVAFALDEGEISEVLEDPRNFYVLYVEEKTYGRTAPLSEVREQVERRVSQKARADRIEKWIQRLRDKAVIRYY